MGQDVTKYTYRIRWSEEDGEYLATVAEFPSLSWLEENQADAFEGIVNLVRDVVEDMGADGEKVPTPFSMREYSRSVRLRIPPEQHRELTVRAAEEGVSLNRLLCSLISRPAGTVADPAKSDLADTVAEDRAPTLRNGPTRSITVLTEAPSSRNGLKLVASNENTVKHASETGRLEPSNGYDEWPEEM